METTVNFLPSLFTTFNIPYDVFYSIRISSGFIILQGKYNSDILKTLIEKTSMKFNIDEDGYAVSEVTNKYLNITLSDEITVKIIFT